MNKHAGIDPVTWKLLGLATFFPLTLAALRSYILYYPPLKEEDEDEDLEPSKTATMEKEAQVFSLVKALMKNPMLTILALGPTAGVSAWASDAFFKKLRKGFIRKKRKATQEKYKETMKELLRLTTLQQEAAEPGVLVAALPEEYREKLHQVMTKQSNLGMFSTGLMHALNYSTVPLVVPALAAGQTLRHRWSETALPKLTINDLIEPIEEELEDITFTPSIQTFQDDIFLRELEKHIENALQENKGTSSTKAKKMLEKYESKEESEDKDNESEKSKKETSEMSNFKRQLLNETISPSRVTRKGVTIVTK